MKEVIKYIILTLVVVLIGGYLIWGAVWFSARTKPITCSAVEWVIKDSLERQFVTPDELTHLMHNTNLNPKGKTIDRVLTQAIESCVTSHPMVRSAQCFVTTQGRVIVRLTQRQPLLGIKTDNASYYVDTDRLRMPTSPHVTTPLIWATGNVEESSAKKELADIVVWLQDQSRWENRFERIDVKDKNNITLIDTTGLKVRIGDGSEFVSKMHKLHLFEEQMAKIGGKEYKELDLRYKDQVIGRE